MATTINQTLLRRLIGLLFIIAVLLLLSPLLFTSKNEGYTLTDETGQPEEAKQNHLVLSMHDDKEDDSSVIPKIKITSTKEDELLSSTKPQTQNGEVIPEGLWDAIEEPKIDMPMPNNEALISVKTEDKSENKEAEKKTEKEVEKPATSPATISDKKAITQSPANQPTKTEAPASQSPTTQPEHTKPKAPQQVEKEEKKPAIQLASISQQAKNTPPSSLPPASSSGGVKWYVQTGGFANRQNALNVQTELKKSNFPAIIFIEDGLNKVQIGPYNSKAEAQTIENNLKSRNLPATLISR